MDTRRRGRIPFFENSVQYSIASPLGNAGQSRSQSGPASGVFEQSIPKGSKVQTGSPDHHRQFASLLYVSYDGGGGSNVVGSRELPVRLHQVDEVMGNPLAVWDRHLAGSDVEVTVDLKRIAAHDLAVEHLCQLDGKSTLTGSSRSDQGNHDPAFRSTSFRHVGSFLGSSKRHQ
jgi:hypothetical protein